MIEIDRETAKEQVAQGLYRSFSHLYRYNNVTCSFGEAIYGRAKMCENMEFEHMEEREPFVLFCVPYQVATGAFMFVADLVREIRLPILIEFIRIRSYGNAMESSGVAVLCDDIKMDISDKHVLVVTCNSLVDKRWHI